MNDMVSGTAVMEQLEQMLAAGNLSSTARKKATHLLERLQSPVRIVILGLPGSGKSQLLNLLAGARIIPDNAALPTLELAHGADPQTICTMQDGTTEAHDGLVLDKIDLAEAAFIRVETPLPMLEQVSLLEVVCDDSAEGQMAAIEWAAQRADIALWCSPDFTAHERALWSGVPDGLKDHSFFVLNKADLLASEGTLPPRIQLLQDIVADEFHSLFPLATLQAIAASPADGPVDAEMWAASGGQALITAILRLVDQGRQADIVGVQIFLDRHSPSPSKESSEKTPQGETDPKNASNAETSANVQASPVSSNGGDQVPDQQKLTDDLCSTALSYLHQQAAGLSHSLAEPGAESTSDVLEQCLTTTVHLAEMFEEVDADQGDLFELQDDFIQAAEILLLLQLETGPGPAADAVTLLLQLQRGLEARMAA